MGGLDAAGRPAPAQRFKVYFDGGARPNPGRIEAAVVARGQVSFFDDLGCGSSTEAEWRALVAGLEVARSLGGAFDLLGDCAHVVAQANGLAPCRSQAAREGLAVLQAAAESGGLRRVRWVPRNRNLAGIALSRRHDLPR